MKMLDNSTRAAIPGGLVLSREKYVEYFGKNALDRKIYRFCSQLPEFIRLIPILGGRVAHWVYIQEYLLYGCLNPAVVLDSDRRLIAVFTSLTAVGDTPTPVIKILQERLDLIDPSRTTNGSRFAAASVYSESWMSRRKGQWSDFFPIVVDCLVDDRESCENAIARLKPLAWEALEYALEQLDGKNKPGLYYVEVPRDMVWNAF